MEENNYKLKDRAELEALAKNKDAKAMYYLGNIFFMIKNSPEDRKKAVEWYIKSANAGYLTAQISLINRFTIDREVKPCFTAAYYWLEKAVATDRKKVAIVRPELLTAKEIVEKTSRLNSNKREKYEEAGKLGFAYAYTKIAKMYRSNPEKAMPYLKLACDMGEIEALEMMTQLHTEDEEYYKEYLEYANNLMKKFC